MRPIGGMGAFIPGGVWEQLVQAGHEKVYQPGTTLLWQGEKAPYVLVLLSGQVKVSRVDTDWKKRILAVRGPGEILGELRLLDEAADTASATVEATEVCVTRAILADEFLGFVEEHGLENLLLSHVSRRLREGDRARAELSVLRAGPRVARGLLHLVTGLYSDGTQLPNRVEIKLARQELPLVVNLARTTVSEQLSKLRQLGVIQPGRGRIVVTDLRRLRALCQAEDLPDVR